MIWRSCRWFLLLFHFFLPPPFREQLLAIHTVLLTLTPAVLPIHIATGFVVLLFFGKFSEIASESVPMILHHLVVFMYIWSEYYLKEWRYTCGVVLCWSVRWMNPTNIYSEHPFRAVVRCALFGLMSCRHFSWSKSVRWCWIFLVHEFFYVLIPVQMLYEVYMKKVPPVEIV